MNSFPRKLPYQVLLNQLILVDSQDRFLSSFDKWQAHSNHYLAQAQSHPHRAFSVFLFNQNNQLLLQQRSSMKRTFPLGWTNSCCSHPNMVQMSNGKIDQEPIREAIHRALYRQLGMFVPDLPFFFMNKILYKQKGYKQDFGEYEVDYVYLSKLENQVKIKDVPQQIANYKWLSKKEMPNFIEEVLRKGGYITPWFRLMYQSGMISKWWDLIEKSNLSNAPGENQNKVIQMK